MKNTNSTQPNRNLTMTKPNNQDDIIIVIITLISILITELISCFTPSLKKSPQPSAMNPSVQKKESSSTKRIQTSKTHPKAPSSAPVTSTGTSEVCCVASGSQPETTTQPKRRTNSQVGTTSQPTKRSKSGRSTAPASHQEKMKLNQTTPTAGLGFSA